MPVRLFRPHIEKFFPYLGRIRRLIFVRVVAADVHRFFGSSRRPSRAPGSRVTHTRTPAERAAARFAQRFCARLVHPVFGELIRRSRHHHDARYVDASRLLEIVITNIGDLTLKITNNLIWPAIAPVLVPIAGESHARERGVDLELVIVQDAQDRSLYNLHLAIESGHGQAQQIPFTELTCELARVLVSKHVHRIVAEDEA
mmetsp:Transcript_15756/g.50219  ORF Transcript_15756/g.50219 Transcript_15756/m.50219 type:complete len:201 (+) Transcript_15756:227-829(+)